MLELSRNGKIVILGVAVPTAALFLYWLLHPSDDDENTDSHGKNRAATSRQTLIEMPIPRKLVGSIIGRQGSTIKKLQEQSGARINFKDDTNSEDTDRTITIRGTPESAQAGELLIREMLANVPVIVQEEMFVAPYTLGRIIGRGGESVRQMSRGSNCKIYIDRTQESYRNKPRLITLVGSKEQIVLAKGMIQEKVDEEEEFRAKTAVGAANREARINTKASKPLSHDQSCDLESNKMVSEVTHLNETWDINNQTSDNANTHTPLSASQFPRNKDFVDVYVSAIATPSVFWVQTVTAMSLQLDELSNNMTRHYEMDNASVNLSTLKKDDIVAAVFENDNTWYRARVMGIKGRELDLFYIDYGDSAYLDVGEVRPLRPDFLSIPSQAIECRLAGMKPAGPEWSENAFDCFEDLTHCAKWKVVVGKAEMFEGNMPYLTLIDTNSTSDININNELVNRGFAVLDNET